MSKIQERIKQFIDVKNISVREFCRIIGVSPSFLARDAEISSDKLLNIINAFPEIFIEWLLTGKGKMCIEPQMLGEPKVAYQTKRDIHFDPAEQKMLLEIIQSLNSQIEELRDELKLKDKQLGDSIKTNLLLLERERGEVEPPR